MTPFFDREQIDRLLVELAAELDGRGVTADVFLVGGAAMAVAYDNRRATRDLDAVFVPTTVVREAAASLAERRGLPPDWLNDAVKGFLPGDDANASHYLTAPGLRVDVASPRYLLAMKLFAARPESDADDIKVLYQFLGFTTVEEGLELVSSAYPNRPVQAKVQFLLEEIVDSFRGT